MSRRVALFVSAMLLPLALSGCGGWFDYEEREPWRDAAEAACLRSGVVKQTADIRISETIDGPGVCGAQSPFKVDAFEIDGTPSLPALSYTDEPLLPPGTIGASHPVNRVIAPAEDPYAVLGPAPMPMPQATPTPTRIALSRTETLACPMVPALTRWLNEEVQPAALANFGSPVVEMKTAGSYNCRKRNHARTGRWSEHAFANALDVSGFVLADGRTTSLRNGWRGSPDEQSFWRDIAYGGCRQFNTVLGPGSDGKHEHHLHLDLARHSSKRSVRVCRPRVPSDWVSAAARVNAAARPMPADFTDGMQDPRPSDVDF
ncbi:MAG: extensin family protein [Labrys sp. (in: a-proteobacteria)]